MIGEIKSFNDLYLKWIDTTLGWGVFTNNDIKKDDNVEICHCIMDNYISSPLKDYVFQSFSGGNDTYHVFGFGPIYNHSYEPNIDYKIIENDGIPLFRFYAIRDIKTGEELRHNYGVKYWENKSKKILI